MLLWQQLCCNQTETEVRDLMEGPWSAPYLLLGLVQSIGMSCGCQIEPLCP